MSIKQVMRWGWSIFLCCLIFFFNIQSAKAEVNFSLPSVQPVNINTDFISNSFRNVGDGLNYFVESGMADSAIKSVSDGFVSGFGQVGGGIAGSFGGTVVSKTAEKQATNLSRNFLKALAPNNNHKLIPALF